MQKRARETLEQLGSEKAKQIGWRDMWAMVTIKGGRFRCLQIITKCQVLCGLHDNLSFKINNLQVYIGVL